MKGHIVLIIPTYNEVKNLGGLVDALETVFSSRKDYRFSIVVVDGNSPDGTAVLAKEKAVQYGNINVIVEKEKRGLGSAYVQGMLFVMNNLKVDAFIEFDGDGQHNPTDVIRLVEEYDRGYDYVIGSRYVPFGSAPKEWGIYRSFISRIGGMVARWVLELSIKDPTSGLKLSRIKGFANRLGLSGEHLISRRFAYKIQLLYEMVILGAKVKEIPIVFRVRIDDVSKSSFVDIIESLRVVFILRWRNLRNWSLPKVVLVGGFGFIVQTIFFEILAVITGWLSASVAVVLSAEMAIISNYFFNQKFSFKNRQPGGGLAIGIAKFHLVSICSVFLQWLLVFLAERIYPGDLFLIHVAYVLGVVLGFLLNYTGYSFFIWSKSSDRGNK